MRKYTKAEKQRWFENLTPEEKQAFVYRSKQKKADERRDLHIKLMSQFSEKFDCKDCIHRKTMSCTDLMPNGCPYFYDAIKDRTAPESVIPNVNKKKPQMLIYEKQKRKAQI